MWLLKEREINIFFYKYVVMLKKEIKFVNKSRHCTFLYFFVVNPKIAYRYSVLKIYSICPVFSTGGEY